MCQLLVITRIPFVHIQLVSYDHADVWYLYRDLCDQQLALLTDIKIKIDRIPKKKVLIGFMEDAGKLPALFLQEFREKNISWGRKFIVQKKRASLNDFDRFKVMLAKIKVVMKFVRQNVANQAARREVVMKFLRRKVAKLDQHVV
ncbi:hypothetical protein MKX01_016856 [Papaver californicum]|nr:hypothetical protein MKX01_016856 [Papaver californicum]